MLRTPSVLCTTLAVAAALAFSGPVAAKNDAPRAAPTHQAAPTLRAASQTRGWLTSLWRRVKPTPRGNRCHK